MVIELAKPNWHPVNLFTGNCSRRILSIGNYVCREKFNVDRIKSAAALDRGLIEHLNGKGILQILELIWRLADLNTYNIIAE
jgi:hypothetical protein